MRTSLTKESRRKMNRRITQNRKGGSREIKDFCVRVSSEI